MDKANTIEMKRKSNQTPEVEEREKVGDVERLPSIDYSRPPVEERKYPDTLHLTFATVALMVAVFLVALDVNILGIYTSLAFSDLVLTIPKQLLRQRSRRNSTVW